VIKRPLHYRLIGRLPVPCELMEWARWFETADDERRVALAQIGPLSVSTVFLGTDYEYRDGFPAILFETMIFGSDDHANWYQTLCETWADAELMHRTAVSHAEQIVASAAKLLEPHH
jgi:hypothetical protein